MYSRPPKGAFMAASPSGVFVAASPSGDTATKDKMRICWVFHKAFVFALFAGEMLSEYPQAETSAR